MQLGSRASKKFSIGVLSYGIFLLVFKNMFFCPDCGSLILITKDEHDNEIKICPHCKRDFNDKL